MGPTSAWGLHLIKWYLCTEPRFRGGAVIEAVDVAAEMSELLPDVARKWEAWEVDIALNILKNDEAENGEKVGVVKSVKDDDDDEEEDDDDDDGHRFVLIESRLPSPAKLTREVGFVTPPPPLIRPPPAPPSPTCSTPKNQIKIQNPCTPLGPYHRAPTRTGRPGTLLFSPRVLSPFSPRRRLQQQRTNIVLLRSA